MGFLRFHASATGAIAAVGSGVGIGLWLVFVTRFDIGTSPSWQFGFYYLMLALIVAASALTGCHPVFSWMGWSRWLLPALVFVLLGFFFAASWVVSGPFEGFRDERYYSITIRAAALSVIVVAHLGLLKISLVTVFLVARQMGWRRVMAFPLVSRVASTKWCSANDVHGNLDTRHPG